MNHQRYMALAEQTFALHEGKSGDYGSERLYFPLGDASYVQMLHVKTTRLVSLVFKEGDEVTYESVKDTVRDLINYAMFYLDYLENPDEQV